MTHVTHRRFQDPLATDSGARSCDDPAALGWRVEGTADGNRAQIVLKTELDMVRGARDFDLEKAVVLGGTH